MNERNIKSFNSSTCLRAIKDDILLVRPQFLLALGYQASGDVEPCIGAVITFYRSSQVTESFRLRISFKDEFVWRPSFSTCTGPLVVFSFTADVEANLLCKETESLGSLLDLCVGV